MARNGISGGEENKQQYRQRSIMGQQRISSVSAAK